MRLGTGLVRSLGAWNRGTGRTTFRGPECAENNLRNFGEAPDDRPLQIELNPQSTEILKVISEPCQKNLGPMKRCNRTLAHWQRRQRLILSP